ncbi:MAG: hypothetical protein U1F30_08485 [Steroidobacteraceae bacterium]
MKGRMLEPNSVPSSTTAAMRSLRGEKSDSRAGVAGTAPALVVVSIDPPRRNVPDYGGSRRAPHPVGAIHS